MQRTSPSIWQMGKLRPADGAELAGVPSHSLPAPRCRSRLLKWGRGRESTGRELRSSGGEKAGGGMSKGLGCVRKWTQTWPQVPGHPAKRALPRGTPVVRGSLLSPPLAQQSTEVAQEGSPPCMEAGGPCPQARTAGTRWRAPCLQPSPHTGRHRAPQESVPCGLRPGVGCASFIHQKQEDQHSNWALIPYSPKAKTIKSAIPTAQTLSHHPDPQPPLREGGPVPGHAWGSGRRIPGDSACQAVTSVSGFS